MAESEKLYEQIKNFFLKEEKDFFVIEMSDNPMAEWNVVYVDSVEEMMDERLRLMKKNSNFAGFIKYEGHYNFYYVDSNFVKSQNVENGEIVAFSDLTVKTFDIAKVVEELRQLQGS